jgi:hypothetical protein
MTDPTPAVVEEIDRLLDVWQDSQAFVSLVGVLQACITSMLLTLGGKEISIDEPEALRTEAADLTYASAGLATFLERLAVRLEAQAN